MKSINEYSNFELIPKQVTHTYGGYRIKIRVNTNTGVYYDVWDYGADGQTRHWIEDPEVKASGER